MSIRDVSRNSSDTDSDARVSSFYSPSPAVRTRGPTRANVKIGVEDFDTPTTTFVNDNKKTDKMSLVLSKPIAHSPIVTEKDLEAPGKFVSRVGRYQPRQMNGHMLGRLNNECRG